MTSAIAVFQGPQVFGTVKFKSSSVGIQIYINLSGPGLIPNGQQGFHIHEYGDLSDGCNSACAHYNPYNKTHGCPGDTERHLGDLGNITTDMFGNANYKTSDTLLKLQGETSIIGRMVIIHENEDDCGKGEGSLKEESLKTGNAGKRIACAVIGYAKKIDF